MLINSHGMHWERFAFFNAERRLIGIPFGKGSDSDGMDFTEHTGVYVLEDMLQKPVYVGYANALGKRLEDHIKKEKTHNSWDYFSWFSIVAINNDIKISTLDLAMGIESILIRFLNPRLNKKEESIGKQYWQKGESIHTLNGQLLELLSKHNSDA